jgi:hypothetical protein
LKSYPLQNEAAKIHILRKAGERGAVLPASAAHRERPAPSAPPRITRIPSVQTIYAQNIRPQALNTRKNVKNTAFFSSYRENIYICIYNKEKNISIKEDLPCTVRRLTLHGKTTYLTW